MLNQIGLVINIMGALLVAFAFGNPPSTASQTDKKGRTVSLAAFLHPRWFKTGVILMVIGFIFMFIATFRISS